MGVIISIGKNWISRRRKVVIHSLNSYLIKLYLVQNETWSLQIEYRNKKSFCVHFKKKRLLKIVDTKTSEKCFTVDEETAKFLKTSNKLQEFKKEQFDKHEVLINPELAAPRNIWIVCEKSQMSNAEKELTSLTDEKTIGSSTFKPMDAMKVRFLREHRWGAIKEKEKSHKTECVTVSQDNDVNSFEIKGTKAGRANMIMYLERLAGNVNFKVSWLFFLQRLLDSHSIWSIIENVCRGMSPKVNKR